MRYGFGSRGRLAERKLPSIYRETCRDDEEELLKKTLTCCGVPVYYCALGIASLEIALSFCTIFYTIAGLYSFPTYNAGLIFHDEMFLEAKREYCGKEASVPVALLYCDLFVFIMELLLALVLLQGIIQNKQGKIHFWLATMVTYTVTLTGILLGFVVGGIATRNLALMGGLHAFFRFFEIAVVYGYYEHMRIERGRETRLMHNNNGGFYDIHEPEDVVSNNYAIDIGNPMIDPQFPFPVAQKTRDFSKKDII